MIGAVNLAKSQVTTYHLPGVGFVTNTGAQSYYNESALGSTLAVRDVNGNFSSRSEYDAYGITSTIQPGAYSAFQFAGKHGYQTDESTGMQLLGLRYYLPTLGRFLTQDPIGQAGGLNLYAYCDNNPLTRVDPDGMRPVTAADRTLLHSLRTRMAAEGFQQAYANQVTNSVKGEIAAVPTGTADPVRLRALWWALGNIGNQAYGSHDGTNRCNRFVYDAYLNGAGVAMPDRRWYPGTQLYSANIFGNSAFALDHLGIVSSGQAGDIYAFGSRGIHGHMTLKVGSGLLIYAGSNDVKLGTFDRNQKHHTPVVIRTYR